MSKPKEKQKSDLCRSREEALAISVDSIEWSIRVKGILDSFRCRTLRHITNLSAQDLLHQSKCGRISLDEIRDVLTARGLYLKNEGPKDGEVFSVENRRCARKLISNITELLEELRKLI